MPLQLITAPTADPIYVGEARAHVKQDITADDPLLSIYLRAAADYAQMQTGRQLVAARYRMTLDSFPGPSLMGVPIGNSFSLPAHAILLDRSPLIQMVAIQYLDMSGALQTMPSSDYTVDASCSPPRITPVFGKIWPISLPQIGAVQVVFDAGYVAPISGNATTDAVSVQGWKTLSVGDVLRLSNSGGALPAPLKERTDYYVQSVISAGVYTLSAASGGAAIDLTDTGSGQSYLGELPNSFRNWMLVRIDSLFNHRGEVAVVKGKLDPLPYVDNLLDPVRVVML